MEADARFQTESTARDDKFERAIFGDKEAGEIGMKQKVDIMYDILVQGRGILGFLGGIRWVVLFAISIGALVAYIKGWLK